MNERLEMAIEALREANDREMARYGFGCSPWDEEPEDEDNGFTEWDFMDDRDEPDFECEME